MALLVLLGHEHGYLPGNVLLADIFQFGSFAAVCGFLVISGYSIAHSIKEKPEHFYERRFRRIFPAFFVAVIVAQIPWLLFGPAFNVPPTQDLVEAPSVAGMLANFAMLQGFIYPALNSNKPLWTLSAEVCYYVFAPFFNKAATKWLLAMIGISALGYMLHAAYFAQRYPEENHGVAAICLLWAWLCGFVYYRNRNTQWALWLMTASGCTLIGYDDTQGRRFSVLVYLIACFVLWRSCAIRLTRQAAKVLNYCGDISYPLYVIHFPALIIAMTRFHIANGFALMSICLGAAALVHHCVELPLRRYWKREDGKSMQRISSAAQPRRD